MERRRKGEEGEWKGKGDVRKRKGKEWVEKGKRNGNGKEGTERKGKEGVKKGRERRRN